MVNELIYLEYLNNLIDGNKLKCHAIVNHVLENEKDIKEIYSRLFARSLNHIGNLWETEKICGATEHMATCITECVMNLTYPLYSTKEKNEMTAVVACVPKEFHQIGAKMVADVFEFNGWNSYYLGANVKTSELLKLIDSKKPNVLALSIGIYLNINRLLETIKEVKNMFPEQEIIVGGYAFKDGDPEVLKQFDNVHYIADLNELDKYIKQFSMAY